MINRELGTGGYNTGAHSIALMEGVDEPGSNVCTASGKVSRTPPSRNLDLQIESHAAWLEARLKELYPKGFPHKSRGRQRNPDSVVLKHFDAVLMIRRDRRLSKTAAINAYAAESGMSVRRIWAAFAKYQVLQNGQRELRRLGYEMDEDEDE